MTETEPHSRALALLRGYTRQDLLEVAVGTGTELAGLSADSERGLCVGLDLSANMLKRARRRIGRALNGRALPFRAASFDCLLSCYLIDLLPDRDIPVVLREFHRVLRSEGVLVLAVMAGQTPILQRPWMMLFHHVPALVGGCRPVDAAAWLRVTGWNLYHQERVSQNGFRSEVLVASPTIRGLSLTPIAGQP